MCRPFLLMFARLGDVTGGAVRECREIALFRRLASPAVAKVQCARDSIVQIVDSEADDTQLTRTQSATQGSRRATIWDRLFAFWVSPTVYTQYGRIRKLTLQRCNCRGSTIVTIHPGVQHAVLSHGEAGAGLRHRLNEGAPFAAQAQARGPARFLEIRPISGVLAGASPPTRALSRRLRRCSMPCARLLGQAQRGRTSRHAYFSRRVLPTGMLGRFIRPWPICWRNAPD